MEQACNKIKKKITDTDIQQYINITEVNYLQNVDCVHKKIN